MAKPLVAVGTILDTALRLIDEQGAEALSARNLASSLKCSTRTLYEQVGKRDALIGKLIEHHFHSQELEFQSQDTWQQSIAYWAATMRGALLAHPNLYRLMTPEHRAPVADYVTQLLKVLLKAGFEEEMALRSCRVLVNITLSMSLSEINAPDHSRGREKRRKEEIQFEDLIVSRKGGLKSKGQLQAPPEVFENAITWVVAGIENELSTSSPKN